jgi:monothiol glutaredoxin
MKGTKNKPLCGFSKNVVDILSFMEVDFIDINVLTDNDINKKSEKEEHYLLDLKDVNSNDIRQGIKDYSNWPTIPQLYIKTEFIGGFDIVKDMFVSKNLHAFLKEKNIKFKE